MLLRWLQVLMFSILIFCGCSRTAHTNDLAPGNDQLAEDFLKLHFGLFLHFNIATYIDRGWANGYENPEIFAPKKLDCSQWAKAAQAAGMKYAVLTVKHTGGWCLWDSGHTTHDITQFKNYKNGKGDIVRDFVNAFRAEDIKVGFYYCFPGNYSYPKKPHNQLVPEGKPDLHGMPAEAAGDYIGFIIKQFTELLTNYGQIDLLWIDQCRNICSSKDWQRFRAHVKSLQPQCLVIANNDRTGKFSDVYSCELPWDPNGMPPQGNTIPAEICDKISGYWFWNTKDKPENIKSAQKVVDTIKLCNQRHANYLLNVTPNRDGQISDVYLKRLRQIGILLGAQQSKTNLN